GVWWLSPVRDLLSAAIHVCGFMTRTVMWRGRRFRVGRDGRLTPYRPQAVHETPEPRPALVREPSSAI
ncbi:MAG: hypothetical protein WA840_03300, partial [Caulobacteraceae bacterium]